MENFYELFDINQNAKPEDIEQDIKNAQKKWNKKMNNHSLEVQAEADKNLKLLEEVKKILLDPNEKEKYDLELENYSKSETEQTNNSSSTDYHSNTYEESIDDDYIVKFENMIELYKSKNIPSALKEVNEMKSLYPDDALVWQWSGILNEEFSNYEEAETSYLMSIELNPTREESYVDLAKLYFYNYNAIEHAIKRLDQALIINPKSEDALYMSAQLYEMLGNKTDSVDYYNELIQNYPRNKTYREEMNKVQQELDINHSKVVYKEATSLNRNKYFDTESDVHNYINKLEQANELHPRKPYTEMINSARSKLKISVDFKFLSLLILPMLLEGLIYNLTGIIGFLIIAGMISYILFNGICKKWKIEKRRALPIIKGPVISVILMIIGGLNLLLLISFLIGAPRLVAFLVIISAIVYYLIYPKFNVNKNNNKVIQQ